MEAAIQQWKITSATADNSSPTPDVEHYDKITLEWKEKDNVKKLLGMFSSHRLYEDWCVAEPDEGVRLNARWPAYVKAKLITSLQKTRH